jgi:exodeoxyribonuclease VIII
MMDNVSLDLETMGTGPSAAIVAIGAVAFDLEARETGSIQFYSAVTLNSSMEAGLELDADTVMWWMQQSVEARSALYAGERIGLPLALEEFSRWLIDIAGKDAKVWGNGATFDNVVISSAYKACGLDRPWSFRNDRCYRTVRALHPEIADAPNFGTKHNALDDARYQAAQLIKMIGGRK